MFPHGNIRVNCICLIKSGRENGLDDPTATCRWQGAKTRKASSLWMIRTVPPLFASFRGERGFLMDGR
ncbi:hypothetical protein GTNG_1217 [Geobacillus thermodenitrificans NG80-2]|uniref:Uncharacterized protein n=1 Tax=Geobacillus thermodenitrificans (strain NG80-2) TaxID=420246 RepID=A4IMN5_GEOTN|nr:hypothetical protein GTNG_1217 [Geobacillus thermodenitrificans NG80-2]